MNPSIDLVIASYHRARQSGELFDTFYAIFLAKAPEIPAMFARTDFPHQKLMLRESLLEVLAFAQTGSGSDEIERLAARHRALNVKPVHYEMWLEALCEALARHDDQFDAQLERLWREALRKTIQIMAG